MYSNSRGAREYAKFRPTKHGRTAVAIINDDEATLETLEVTASGNTEMLETPGETANLVVKGFHCSNADSSTVIVSLRAGTGGKKYFTTMLAANGGNFDKPLVGRYWRLPLDKPLVVNLSGASDVWVTVEYEVEGEPAQEAATLTETLAITEGITKISVTKAVTDSQSIAETLGHEFALSLEDSISVSESLVITGDRSKALEDTLSIGESLANGATLSLSDSESLAASISIQYIPG